MGKAILVENDPELRKLYELNLELYLGLEVISLYNADAVAQYLKEDSAIDLIVCEKQVGDENTILKVFYFVKSNKYQIPVFLLGEEFRLKEEVEMFERANWKAVIKKAAKILNVTAESMVNKDVPDFYPIPMRHFLHLTDTNVDIYDFGREKEDDPQMFFLKFKSGDSIDKKLIEEFIVNKKEFFYVPKFDRLKFINYYSEKITRNLVRTQESLKGRVTATASAFYASQELMNISGMDTVAIEAAKTTITSMMKVAEESQGLSELLDILERDRTSYLYNHALLIAAVAHFIVPRMEWGTKEQKEKICIAAFFHDIAIPDDRLARVCSKEAFAAGAFTTKDKDRILKHASIAAEMLKEFPQTPIGTEMIVLQHHGQVNGIGFPEGHNSNLTPLAIVFYVVEEYVNTLLNTPKDKYNKEVVLEHFRQRFNKGYYRKTIDALALSLEA